MYYFTTTRVMIFFNGKEQALVKMYRNWNPYRIGKNVKQCSRQEKKIIVCPNSSTTEYVTKRTENRYSSQLHYLHQNIEKKNIPTDE